jgi:hypothetical protein
MEKLITQSAVPLLTLLSAAILITVGVMLGRARKGEGVGFDRVNGNPRPRGPEVGSASDVFDAGGHGGCHGGGGGDGHGGGHGGGDGGGGGD